MTLNDRIRHFYDSSTHLWLDTWGEHMHHGHYGQQGSEKKNHQQAQLDLIHELLRWGGVTEAGRILDAGCGVGGSARHLAGLFGAQVLGLTLSPVQAAAAGVFNQKAGMGQQVEIRVQDMLTLTADDGPFDLVWSLESAEHIGEKQRLLEIFYTVLKPGGQFLMATWCHREKPPSLDGREEKLLRKIGQVYHLPPLAAAGEIGRMARTAGFTQIKTADWSDAVAPFWKAVIRSAFRWQSVRGLLRSGGPAIRGAWAMRYMTRGYRLGTLRFGLIQGQKP